MNGPTEDRESRVPAGVTQLLNRWAAGSREALDELMPLVMGELRRLARHALARRRGGTPTLQPTALVNEAFLRLVDVEIRGFENRSRFFALAARILRTILLDHGKRRLAGKRQGGRVQVPIEEALPLGTEVDLVTLLAVGEALERLEGAHPRQAQVVEMRLFAGLSLPEIAACLGCSLPTVERDWAVGRRRVARDLQGPH